MRRNSSKWKKGLLTSSTLNMQYLNRSVFCESWIKVYNANREGSRIIIQGGLYGRGTKKKRKQHENERNR